MISLNLTKSQTLAALRGFLLSILPSTVEVVQGLDNRVAEPSATDFVTMTPIIQERLETNTDTYVDAVFTGSINGTTLTISAVSSGALVVGSQIYGVGLADNTIVTAFGTGTGGLGNYTISPAQTVTSRTLAAGTKSVKHPEKVTVQLDVHGTSSYDNSTIIATLFRDSYAVDKFAASGFDVTPLYAGEPKQIPFLNGEQQIEERWSIDAVLQCNPTVTIPQEFAAALGVTLNEVDVFAPPYCPPFIIPPPVDFGVVQIAGPSATPYSVPAPTTTYQTIATNPCGGILRKRIDTVYSQSTAPVYATWNPADKSSGVSLLSGDLVVSGATGPLNWSQAVRANVPLTSGKWSWQTKIDNQPIVPISPAAVIGSIMFGVSTAQENINNGISIGTDAFGWAYYNLYQGSVIHNNVNTVFGRTLNINDVVTSKLDMDLGTLRFEVNGVDQGIAFTGITGTIYPTNGVFSYNSNFSFGWTTNFGASPFPYPVPAGYNAGVFYTTYYLNDHVTWTYEQV